MPAPKARKRYGDELIDRRISELIEAVGSDNNDDLTRSIIVSALDMDTADVDRLEMKIANQTLVEMLNAWRVFAPYAQAAKVSIFGSARTAADHPNYHLAERFAKEMAKRHWMAITGAGPGIMTAGLEGAGRANSFGVNIMLPFEQQAAGEIAGDDKLANFRYFFTRKLTFMKESDGFVLLPGGFGTMDETFELLTLVQTGKSYPVPIVMLDHEGSNYWSDLANFIRTQLLAGGLISDYDTDLYLHTHDVDEAVEYITSFYSCYQSLRYVGKMLVIRTRTALDDDALAVLNQEFADLVVDGAISRIDTTGAELADNDHVDLPRVAFHFVKHRYARLVTLVRRINELGGTGGDQTPAGLVHDVGPSSHDDEL